nr:unnamed protein product [Callosobruchus analis]
MSSVPVFAVRCSCAVILPLPETTIFCVYDINESIVDNSIITRAVAGAEREYPRSRQKWKNRSELAKSLRHEDKEYYSTRTRETVPASRLLDRCKTAKCEKFWNKYGAFSDKKRLSDIQLRREYVVRHCEALDIR